METDIRKLQEDICGRFGAKITECLGHSKVGVSRNVRDGVMSINGVRVSCKGDTSGWYIWAGDWSDDPDFFVPLHLEHLLEWCPSAIRYLLLPVGWRFQIAPNHEDAWFDPDVVV